jgi:hypothetical protein
MSLAIDELSQSSCYRRRASYAAPATSDRAGLGALCVTVFAPSLAPGAAFAPGTDTHSWCPHRHGRLAGDGLAADCTRAGCWPPGLGICGSRCGAVRITSSRPSGVLDLYQAGLLAAYRRCHHCMHSDRHYMRTGVAPFIR